MISEAVRRALQADVRTAFGGVVRPEQDFIALHQCDECAALRAEFAHERRDAMSDDLIECHENSLPLLSPEALVYFLPAYLLYALEHLPRRASASEYTVYAVSPTASENPELENWAQERVALFTDQQATVIDRFLELVEHDDDFGEYTGDISERRLRFQELRAKCGMP